MNAVPPARLAPPTRCEHCGNSSSMEILGSVADLKTVVDAADTEEGSGFSRDIGWIYELHRCPRCEKVNLARFHFEDMCDLDEDRSERLVVYPVPPRTPAGLPDRVKAAWQAACADRYGAGNSYAASLRRLLEGVCRDRGAAGEQLFARLKQLARQESFPPALATLAEYLRKFGNIGAHDDPRVIAREDIRQLEDSVLQILGHVYEAPLLAEKARAFAERHAKS